MSKFCAEISFVSNIWDVDHKKNSQFLNTIPISILKIKKKLYNYIIHKAFKILAPNQSIKKN